MCVCVFLKQSPCGPRAVRLGSTVTVLKKGLLSWPPSSSENGGGRTARVHVSESSELKRAEARAYAGHSNRQVYLKNK